MPRATRLGHAWGNGAGRAPVYAYREPDDDEDFEDEDDEEDDEPGYEEPPEDE